MARSQKSPKGNPFPLIPVLAGAAGLAILLALGGFTFAASQESHDAFCASCHTQPESTFYQNATNASAANGQEVDLASFHTTQKIGCIDCHSGPGLSGRVQAELMGARNAAKWYTGSAIQPAQVTFPIGDQNCMKCHQDVVQRGFTPKEQITVQGAESGEREREGRNNHWHTFMARWQAATPSTAGTCVSCHSGHQTGSTAQDGFMQAQNVQSTCEACHRAIRQED